MLNVGDKARVTKNKSYKGRDLHYVPSVNRQATIYALDEYKITVEYIKNNVGTSRESFNLADIIEDVAEIDVKSESGWVRVGTDYFKKRVIQ